MTAGAESTHDYAVMKVYYATDRAMTGNTDVNDYFGGGRASKLRLGTAFVSIPRQHERGHLESPSIWRLEIREDPNKHIVLLRIRHRTRDQFWADVSATVDSSEERDALVFIHGYNVSFADAARRTAQLAYDLTFQGAPILYSWPSRANVTQYLADRQNAEWTVSHLEGFLREVAAHSGARTVHLVAHSMGNAALVSALDRIARTQNPPPQLFKHVALTAPDIDAGVLEQLAVQIRPLAAGVTMYVSRDDVALQTAERFYQNPRAGQTIMILPNIDTIDASNVDTSFLGHAPSVTTILGLTDLRELLLNDLPPARRGLKERFLAGRRYWLLQP